MFLIITDTIKTHELAPLSRFFSFNDLVKSIKKIATSGIAMGNLGFTDCKLIKVRIGHKPAGRMIVYLQTKKDYYFPVIVRLKKDKIFGQNLSLQNKIAEKKIIDNLRLIFADIEKNRYEKHEL